MPENTASSGKPEKGQPSRLLADRVRDRVADARIALDRRAGASRPKARRPRPVLADSPLTTADGDLARHSASLRVVFTDLGDTYRQYRRRTGAPVIAPLREAAMAFKQEPSLISLVPVAAFLDELGILGW